MKKITLFMFAVMFTTASCEDGAGNNNNNETDPLLLAYAENMAHWQCNMQLVCCAQGQKWSGLAASYEDYDTCFEAEKARLVTGMQIEGAVTLDTQRLADAWDAHQAYYGTDCDSPPDRTAEPALHEIVDQLWVGQLEAGAACTETVECPQDFKCDQTGHCAALPGEGENCDALGCAAGSTCHFPTGTCEAILAVGDACNWELDVPCLDRYNTLTCDEETDLCVAQYENGAACVSNNNCNSQICGEDGLCVAGTPPISVGEQFCQDTTD